MENKENQIEQENQKEEESKKSGLFSFLKEYKVKDIVFLSIISGIAILCSAVMPLVLPLIHEIFGIAQIVTGFQLTLFFVIGLYKVRKPFALFYMALFSGIIQAFMSPVVFAGNLLSAFLLEALFFIIFKGKSFDKDYKIFLGSILYLPCTLPFNFLINWGLNGNDYLLEKQFTNPWIVTGLTLAVIAVCALGGLIGLLVSRKLKKSGVIKK